MYFDDCCEDYGGFDLPVRIKLPLYTHAPSKLYRLPGRKCYEILTALKNKRFELSTTQINTLREYYKAYVYFIKIGDFNIEYIDSGIYHHLITLITDEGRYIISCWDPFPYHYPLYLKAGKGKCEFVPFRGRRLRRDIIDALRWVVM